MRIALALTALMLTASCKKQEPPAVKRAPPIIVAGMKLQDYTEPGGAFSAFRPAEWKVLENSMLGLEVTFFGPGNDKHPNSTMISIARFPNSVHSSTSPLDSHAGLGDGVSAYETRRFGPVEAGSYSYERLRQETSPRQGTYILRDDVANIPFPGGYFSITHSAPVEIHKDTLPYFEAVVASFMPGKLPPPKP